MTRSQHLSLKACFNILTVTWQQASETIIMLRALRSTRSTCAFVSAGCRPLGRCFVLALPSRREMVPLWRPSRRAISLTDFFCDCHCFASRSSSAHMRAIPRGMFASKQKFYGMAFQDRRAVSPNKKT